MAAANIYFNGIGGATGAAIASLAPLYTPGTIWYVSNLIGVDAASPAGKDRQKPLATISQAHTNAAAGDVIVCLAGHTEILTTNLALNKAGIVIVGEGTGSSRPKFTRNANISLFTVTVGGVVFWNLYFPASTFASIAGRILINSNVSSYIRDCYFECGANDTGPALDYNTGAGVVVRDTTFISTATLLTAQPHSGLRISNNVTDMDLDAVTFDGGTTGWSNQFAFQGTLLVAQLRAINVDLLNDSDVTLATGSTGYLIPRNKSGSARIVWVP